MLSTHLEVRRLIETEFRDKHVLVVGDLMLDAYLIGDVGRISPEAPVPVVRLTGRTQTPGGSANVLANLIGLGVGAVAAGYVGDDDGGKRLRGLLADAGISDAGIVTLTDRPTTTKTRVLGGHHQMLRLDDEGTGPVGADGQGQLLAAIAEQLRLGVSAVILSDYAKGVLTPEVCRFAIDEARKLGVPVLVDPKGRDFSKYAGATTLTPNLKEFEIATGLDHAHADEAAFAAAGQAMREALRLDYMVVTCGEKGIKFFEGGAWSHHPAVAREVFDVSGAGDTVIATITAGVASGLSLDASVQLANLAAGVVVGKVGTTPIDRRELLDALRNQSDSEHAFKVCDDATLLHRVAAWRARGERVVFTNGCFDLLHVGHVTLLANSRREGDRLVVGLNTDRSVRALKGETRPVVTEGDRAHVLAGLSAVDAVILFDEDTPLRLIEAVRPDVLVKGGDYEEAQIVGADVVRGHGGRVCVIPLVEGRSTTRMLARSQQGAR